MEEKNFSKDRERQAECHQLKIIADHKQRNENFIKILCEFSHIIVLDPNNKYMTVLRPDKHLVF